MTLQLKPFFSIFFYIIFSMMNDNKFFFGRKSFQLGEHMGKQRREKKKKKM